ncbi:hypothetical protein [Mucilaginibacter agri]|uniref:Uncharacterized protein n=1 Tax=Mucilaginibacter agri TaxID=2695265 RepID=A0A965ZL71_9SPHI|nr:hypothetical protein [Mucilaginibacter agri]NCD71687.1 hypothetical protein [Mucilaginibacter agri]
MENISDLRRALQKCINDSRAHYSIEGLSESGKIREMVKQIDSPFWKELEPLENFFVFEISPAVREKAPAPVVVSAYCTALRELTTDWWGLPAGTPTQSSLNLMAQPEIQKGLAKLLTDKTSLHYVDGEARSYSEIYHFEVSDLAAGFLIKMSGGTYDAYGDVQEREKVKNQLKEKFVNN